MSAASAAASRCYAYEHIKASDDNGSSVEGTPDFEPKALRGVTCRTSHSMLSGLPQGWLQTTSHPRKPEVEQSLPHPPQTTPFGHSVVQRLNPRYKNHRNPISSAKGVGSSPQMRLWSSSSGMLRFARPHLGDVVGFRVQGLGFRVWGLGFRF